METSFENTMFHDEGESLTDWMHRLFTALEKAHERGAAAEKVYDGPHETLDDAMAAARAYADARAEIYIAETALEWAREHDDAMRALAATLDSLVVEMEEELLGGIALPHPGCPF